MVGPHAGHCGCWRIVARRNSTLVFLSPEEIWAFEATGRRTFAHCAMGRFEMDLSFADIEEMIGSSLLRVHRAWLVTLAQVRELQRVEAGMTLLVGRDAPERGIDVPIARERSSAVRGALLKNTIGVRVSRERSDAGWVEPPSAHPNEAVRSPPPLAPVRASSK